MTISIAFIDDHPTFLDGLFAIFRADERYEVVGKGQSADEAVAIAETKGPDIIVMDINMPGNTFEAIARISKGSAHVKVLAFTASARVDDAVSALEAGARGYILKGSTAAELFEAVRCVASGETFITPSFASKVITKLHGDTSHKPQETRLSVRETQIVNLLLAGHSNREIASALDLSEKTVKHYMTILMQKLHVRSRLEVVLAVQRIGTTNGATTAKNVDFQN